jgi:hypothetical protein
VESNFSNPQSGSVTAVSGSWIVPAVTGLSSGSTYSSVWVGIDGYSDSTVEQIGTEQDWINGRAYYQAWWEMYSSGIGQPEQPISMTIMPGDSVTASVTYLTSGPNAGQFLLSIVDNSRPNDSFSTYQSSSQTQSPLAQQNSAEWIVEVPEVGNRIGTLANFGQVTFTGASATINGVTGPINDSAWQSQAINIGSKSGLSDTTSVLLASGTSFVVTYDSSNAGAAVPGKSSGGTLQADADAITSLAPVEEPGDPGVRGAGSTVVTVLASSRKPVAQAKRSTLGSLFEPNAT